MMGNNRLNMIFNVDIMNKKITASDVAAHVGVSRSAVSRAFTEGASVAPEKRAKIIAAAKELGYQPNVFARTLSTPSSRKRSNLVAILISDFSNPYQSYLFEELSSVLQANNKQPMLLNVKDVDDVDELIFRLSGYQVDGVIAVMGSLPAEKFNQCLKLALPLITLGRADKRGLIPSVQTDNIKAGQLAAQHFIEAGLTKLGFLAGRADGVASNERFQGFNDTLLAQGLTPPVVIEAGKYGYSAGFETGRQQANELLKLEGIFCASDALAMGLFDYCRDHTDLAIPKQFRIIGCDNVPQGAWEGYQLTSVAQPVKQIADTVMELLQAMWDEEENIAVMTKLEPTLVRRRTA